MPSSPCRTVLWKTCGGSPGSRTPFTFAALTGRCHMPYNARNRQSLTGARRFLGANPVCDYPAGAMLRRAAFQRIYIVTTRKHSANPCLSRRTYSKPIAFVPRRTKNAAAEPSKRGRRPRPFPGAFGRKLMILPEKCRLLPDNGATRSVHGACLPSSSMHCRKRPLPSSDFKLHAPIGVTDVYNGGVPSHLEFGSRRAPRRLCFS